VLNTIFEQLLTLDESILSTTIVNMQGQIVRYKSKYHIHNRLTAKESDSNNGANYGVWVRATYAMLEQLAKTFGKVQTFVSLHEKVKLVVLPMIETNCLLVLTVLPSANTEYIASKINLLMIHYKQDNGYDDHKEFSIESGTKWAKKH
jgi:hypothetical protein